MGIKETVDEILRNRKNEISNFSGEREKITRIRDCLDNVKSFLNSVGDSEFSTRIESIDRDLKVAFNDFENLKNRLERSTINIGVAGRTHAGKSTLLQTLSGLSEDEIPTADGKTNYKAMPTTAVHSQILNDSKKRAIITFHTRDSFYEKRVHPYLRHFKTLSIHSIADFSAFDFSKLSVEADESKKAEAQADLERLQEISEAYKYFEAFIGREQKVLTGENFTELKNYVSYSYEHPEKRFYPAVDNVKIYSPFNIASSLKDVKVGLIDLPGFGEATAEVDKILLDGIKNDVDCTTLIFPTNNGIFIGKDEIQSFDSISDAQSSIKDKTNFISFIINKTKDPNGDPESIKKGIKTNFDKTSASPFDIFECSVKHSNEVCDMFSKIITKLATTLPTMDNEVIEGFKSKLSFEDINKLVADIKERYEGNWRSIGGDANEKRLIGEKIKKSVASRTRDLLKKMKENVDNESLKKNFMDEVEKITDKTRNLIDNGLFKGSTDVWTSYLRGSDTTYGGIYRAEQSECHRLRTEILKCYEELDNYYKNRLDDFRAEIGTAFKEETGNFIKESDPKKILPEILTKLSDSDIDFPFLKEAFEFLQSLKIEFRQFIYPYIYKTNILASLDPRDSKWASFPQFEESKKYELLRKHLEVRAIEINKLIQEEILKNNTTEEYIYCALDHFEEILVRNDEEGANSDYTNFADYFYDEITSTKSSGETNWKELNKLLKCLSKAVS